jgi:hypothetical protein
MIIAEESSYQLLETLLGHLNHVACIFMPMRHFLGRLYKALYREKSQSGWTKLSRNELDDLVLHKNFLLYANNGVSLNIIAYPKTTHIYRSDASEFGLGGYSVISGYAWHREIPSELRLHTSINSLEFIACVISIWVDLLRGSIQKEYCILSQTDNTTAAGWLKKSNFSEENDEFIQLTTARHLANLLIDSGSCIYSQWFSGESKSISDSLSRYFHIESDHLCCLLSNHFPLQVPFGLKIQPLPKKIISWVTLLLRSRPQTELWSKELQRSSFACGNGFRLTCSQLASGTTPILMDLTEVKSTNF